MTDKRYYAVTYADGPIVVGLPAQDIAGANREFGNGDPAQWIAAQRDDMPRDLGVRCEGQADVVFTFLQMDYECHGPLAHGWYLWYGPVDQKNSQ